MYKGGVKSLYDDVISVVDNIFYQWDTSTVTLIKKCVDHIWSHSIRAWSAYELFSQPLYKNSNNMAPANQRQEYWMDL